MTISTTSDIWLQLKKVIKLRGILADVQDTYSPELNTTFSELVTAFDNSREQLIAGSGIMDMSVQFNDTMDGLKSQANGYSDSAINLLPVEEDWPADVYGDITSTLIKLRDEMIAQSIYVLKNTCAVGAPSADPSNVGDGEVVIIDTNEVGLQNQFYPPETIEIKCVSDAKDGASAGSEDFSVVGQITYPVDSNTVGGSGVMNNVSVASSGSIISNGDFESFSVTNTPDSWTLDAGVATTNFVQNTSSPVYGSSDLKVIEDATTNPTMSENVYNAIERNTNYILSMVIKTSGITTGTITLKITDGVLTYGVITISAAYPASYTRYYDTFLMPNEVPTGTKIEFKMNACDASGYCLIDDVILTKMTEQPNGTYMSILRGTTTDFLAGDKFTVALTNDFAGNINTFIGRSYGVQLPTNTAGASTVVDSPL